MSAYIHTRVVNNRSEWNNISYKASIVEIDWKQFFGYRKTSHKSRLSKKSITNCRGGVLSERKENRFVILPQPTPLPLVRQEKLALNRVHATSSNHNILAAAFFYHAWIVKYKIEYNKILRICVTCLFSCLLAVSPLSFHFTFLRKRREKFIQLHISIKNIYYLFNCVWFMILDQLIRLVMKCISWDMHVARYQPPNRRHCPFCFMWESEKCYFTMLGNRYVHAKHDFMCVYVKW